MLGQRGSMWIMQRGTLEENANSVDGKTLVQRRSRATHLCKFAMQHQIILVSRTSFTDALVATQHHSSAANRRFDDSCGPVFTRVCLYIDTV